MKTILSNLILCTVLVVSISNASDKTPQSPAEIERWWKEQEFVTRAKEAGIL